MEEGSKNMSTLFVECEGCKRKFCVSSDDSKIKHKVEAKIEGKSIFLTYYDCPDCGRCHFVQIDDQESLRMLNEIKSRFIKLSVAKLKLEDVPEKSVIKFHKARRNLGNRRIMLMKQYTGKSIKLDEMKADTVLRFSV